MMTELRFPVVEVLLSWRIRFLRVFGDDDGDSFGMGFGEDPVRCFCPLCLPWLTTAVAVRCFCLLSFRSGGWKGSVPISSDGGMRFAFSSFVSVSRPGGSGSQLVNAACFLVPNVDARDNTVTHGFILVPATRPYVQQRGVRGHCIILHPECL